MRRIEMDEAQPNDEIQMLEMEINERVQQLEALRKDAKPSPVINYQLKDLNGSVDLLTLFGDKKILFAIHNMGQGCRYCTLWADGLNGFLPHLEDKFAVVMLSKDSPEAQRKMALSRQWRFRMVSHGGGKYIQEQTVMPGQNNMPGIVCYQREEDAIFRKNASIFGPGDFYCPQWHILSLAGVSANDWTAQYNYWQRPQIMDDGGEHLID
jgi:predicted dithiol-disulfide oxidoreductase (DUF899 family)